LVTTPKGSVSRVPVRRVDKPTPPAWVSTYWWALAALGLILLTVGIIVHANPFQRGGPVSLGVIVFAGGMVGLIRKLRAKPPPP
jgi:uncharacterized membrane protein HdeD (DUF308 family)